MDMDKNTVDGYLTELRTIIDKDKLLIRELDKFTSYVESIRDQRQAIRERISFILSELGI